MSTRETELEVCLRDMLDALNALTKDVNWARSVIQADTIRKINEVPIRARTLLGIPDGRETVKTCIHGHINPRVGCVSCALVFDIKPQTE